jgi:glycogen phosphorylase
MPKRTSVTPPGTPPHDRFLYPFVPRPMPPGLEGLNELAMNLRWAWSHAGDDLWQRVDPEAWELTGNPWIILQDVGESRLKELAGDSAFRRELERVAAMRAEYPADPGWYGRTYPDRPRHLAAYFSMEYGIGEALPLYAGGLGVLAGDYLKTASDLGVPVVGVGLLYQEGYFRQMLDADGRQHEAFPYNDPVSLPIFPVRDADGARLRVPLRLPGRTLRVRLWRADVGRVNLYLLDSNDPLNSPADRGITAKLYDADPERRLLQEMVLGICGWRALETLGLPVEVCHLNEGHAAFAILERVRSFMTSTEVPFAAALWATRGGTVTTTHTPVPAGFDRFAPEIVAHYCSEFAGRLKISVDELLALGRANPDDRSEPFTPSFLAARGSGRGNAVSRLHREVSRTLAAPLFPRWPPHDLTLDYITNGVHMPSWDSAYSDEVWTRACGKGRWLGTLEDVCEKFCCATDEQLWEMRTRQRHDLVEHARARLARQLGERGASPDEVDDARLVLDPDALTLGFARRFASYKRPYLLLADPARLERILLDLKQPLQIVVAGKAHPSDQDGKRMVAEMAAFARRPAARHRFVFLEDYDIHLAQHLVQGVDVWLNTPRRPMEACGTSGMKVLVNGGLNLSELDGWWAEAYAHDVGWSIGDGREHPWDGAWDAVEARQLFDVLEGGVIPEFYARDESGFPRAWLGRIRASMSRLSPQFSSNRMLREYVTREYLPAADAFARRAAGNAALARELAEWDARLRRGWPHLRFGNLAIEHSLNRLRVEVHLGEIDPEWVRVELYADPLPGADKPERVPMKRGRAIAGAPNTFAYEAVTPAGRPAEHYTPRIVPYHREARVPFEQALILWLR